MSPATIGLIGIAVFLLLLILRMPIGFAMALVGFLGFSHLVSVHSAITVLGMKSFTSISSYTFTVVPLFMLMGQFVLVSGIGERLYRFAYKWMGSLPGGLAMSTIVGCAGFASVCGSSMATASSMGMVAIPEMRRFKYTNTLSTGCVAAGGTLGILIPPSVSFMIYGIIAEQSIGTLFIAGILPGILLAFLFILTIHFWVTFSKESGPPGPKTSWREKFSVIPSVWEVGVLFALVLGGIFGGVFTPTEAAAAGAFVALLFGIGRKTLNWHNFMESLVETAFVTGMLFIIVIGANIFGNFMAVSKLPYGLAAWVEALNLSPPATMIVIILVYIVLGCFMDTLAMILLTVPIFLPLIKNLGLDPIWFGVIIVVVMEMGLITPPVGLNVYVISGVAKDVPMSTIFTGILLFIIPMAVCVAFLMVFPQIALFLPSIMK